MCTSQHPILSEQKDTHNSITLAHRLVCAGIFLYIVSTFVFLFLSAKGYIKPEYILGVCGFKQRFQLPCPGCGITHSAMEFVTGHIFTSFYTQPAGAILCIFSVILAVFCFSVSVFRKDFGLIERLDWLKVLRYLVIMSIVVFGCGWAVTLSRALMGKDF